MNARATRRPRKVRSTKGTPKFRSGADVGGGDERGWLRRLLGCGLVLIYAPLALAMSGFLMHRLT